MEKLICYAALSISLGLSVCHGASAARPAADTGFVRPPDAHTAAVRSEPFIASGSEYPHMAGMVPGADGGCPVGGKSLTPVNWVCRPDSITRPLGVFGVGF
jgi:hypothetical protein